MKLKQIGAPQPEDVIRASSRDILSKLDAVSDEVLDFFSDTAKVSHLNYKLA